VIAIGSGGSGIALDCRRTRFLKLVRVLFRHDYFEGGLAHGWFVVPDADTQHFMQRFEILLRCDGQEMLLFIEQSRIAGAWSERDAYGGKFHLRFTICSADSASAYYTDMAVAITQNEFTPVAGEPLLQPGEVKSGLLRNKTGALAVVALPLAGVLVEGAGGLPVVAEAEYELRIKAKATIWKYLLVGEWMDTRMRVVDVRDGVQFSPAQEELLPDGRHATTFYSRTPIGLNERPTLRFQLRGGELSGERILISRMPMAAPTGLRHEMVGGVMTEVSEIFINR